MASRDHRTEPKDRIKFVVAPADRGWRVLRGEEVVAVAATQPDAEREATKLARVAFNAGELTQVVVQSRLAEPGGLRTEAPRLSG